MNYFAGNTVGNNGHQTLGQKEPFYGATSMALLWDGLTQSQKAFLKSKLDAENASNVGRV